MKASRLSGLRSPHPLPRPPLSIDVPFSAAVVVETFVQC